MTFPIQTNYIAAKFETAGVELSPWIHDPNTAAPVAPQLAALPDQIERALQAAWEVHESGAWAQTPIEQRAAWLEQVAERMQARVEEIAQVEAASTGVVISLTRRLAQICHLAFGAAAGQLHSGWMQGTLPGRRGEVEIVRKPWGPAVCITPWNAPAALAAHKIANALAAGCPTILKPSEWAPFSCGLLAEVIAEVGVEPGVFQLLHGGGEVGGRLVSDARVKAVSFTGGLHGGRAVARACAHDFKPLQLELGGNNALVVLDDADLDLAAEGVAAGLTTLNGQWCRALGRLIVHEDRAADLLAAASERLAAVRIGHSLEPASQMGPLIHAGHRRLLAEAVNHLAELGGIVHQPTPLPDLPGYFFPPTLVTGLTPDLTLEELFGPVAAVHTFRSDDEALALANQTPYGLGGYVFGRDEGRALAMARRLRTGDVKVNGVSLMSLHPLAPRPAWGLSGFGLEGAAETFQFFCGTTVVGVAGDG